MDLIRSLDRLYKLCIICTMVGSALYFVAPDLGDWLMGMGAGFALVWLAPYYKEFCDLHTNVD